MPWEKAMCRSASGRVTSKRCGSRGVVQALDYLITANKVGFGDEIADFTSGRLNADGMTVLAIEHDMAFVRQVAQRVTVLHLGQVFAQGSIEQIVADERVAAIYLGHAHG